MRMMTISFLLLACVSVPANAGYVPSTTQRVTDAAIEKYALVKISTTTKRVVPLATTDSGALMTGIAQAAAGGSGVTIPVLEVYGVASNVISDGTGVISVGDLVDLSSTTAGRVMKATNSPTADPNTVCTAITSAVAVAGTIFQCL